MGRGPEAESYGLERKRHDMGSRHGTSCFRRVGPPLWPAAGIRLCASIGKPAPVQHCCNTYIYIHPSSRGSVPKGAFSNRKKKKANIDTLTDKLEIR